MENVCLLRVHHPSRDPGVQDSLSSTLRRSLKGLGQWRTEAETQQRWARVVGGLHRPLPGPRESQHSPNLASHPPDAAETIISAVVGGSRRQELGACLAW